MIESARLLEFLAPQGFQIAWEKWAGRWQFNYDFVRASPIDGIYEHIDVDSMGKRGKVAYCRVWVSPVRGHRLLFKPSPEVDEFLAELNDPVTGRSCVIEGRSEAIAWERQVVQVAPERVRSLAGQHAEQIALQTTSERQAAREYARRIRQLSDETVMEYLAYQLGCRATPSQKELARGFDAGFVSGDVQYACECAAIGVALFGAEVDAAYGGFTDEPTHKSLELKIRLNITADILRLGEP